MKKFTKLFLSCAAVAAVTAAVATSAMAASVTGDVEGTYDETTGNLKLTTEFAAKDATILVLAPKTNVKEVKDTDILYINQVADGKFGEMGLMGSPTDDGTYTVMVGSYVDDNFVVKTGTFTIGSAGEEILVGDADGNNRITAGDATVVLQYSAGDKTKIKDEDFNKAAYCDGNNRITAGDATEILKYTSGDRDRQYVGKTLAVGN
ncbi:MAG: dockerin type I repeat-containing protein [Oscillospiraceae bacterium]|nr:dockerin type I repeat-containing protein [Oscillospiraceae bacterium]